MCLRKRNPGCLGGSVAKRLSSARVMIPGFWNRAPHRAQHWAPCSAESPPLPLPLSAALPTYAVYLC